MTIWLITTTLLLAAIVLACCAMLIHARYQDIHIRGRLGAAEMEVKARGKLADDETKEGTVPNTSVVQEQSIEPIRN